MYLFINGKKILIKECRDFSSRFKSFKFYLEKIDFGLKLKNKKFANTYFFCQRVDICFTDKNDVVVATYNNVKSEKIKFKFKARNVYYLPVGVVKNIKIGEIIKEREK